MILRKPYAFLIKKFKLIHLILSVIVAYLIYNTSAILKVYNTYISSKQVSDVARSIGNLSRPFMYVALLIFVVSIVIVATVLKIKKKPILLYVINTIITILVIAVYSYAYSTLKVIQVSNEDIRVVRAIRDILMILIALQGLQFVSLFIRATGFDVKKFDFGADLIGLKVTEEDSEEVELSVELDKDASKRSITRFVKNFKYTFIENKLMFSILIIGVVLLIALLIFIRVSLKPHVHAQGELFTTDSFAGIVNSAYMTNKDSKGNVIDDNYLFIIVNLSVKSFYQNSTLNYGKMYILVNDTKYFASQEYNDYFTDLGIGYKGQLLSMEDYDNYYVVFAVPNGILTSAKEIIFEDTMKSSNNKATVDLNTYYLDDEVKTVNMEFEKTADLSDSMIEKGFIKIDSYEISDDFKISYEFCVIDDCFDSTYTLTPKAYSNNETTILKIIGTASGTNKLLNYSLPTLFDNYGYVSYDNKKSTVNLNLNRYLMGKERNNEMYLEVDKQLIDAKEAYLSFEIRNFKYQIKLK